jgi:hypothetical protein
MNKVEKEFVSKGHVIMMPGNKWFVMSKEKTIEFIEACKQEKIPILGVDGFYLHQPNGTEPSMENSIDYTSQFKKNVHDVYEEARKFIQSRNDDLYFEIICEE